MSAVVTEIEVAKFKIAIHEHRIFEVGCNRVVGDPRTGRQHFMNASHGSHAALEDVDHPAQGNDRPGEHDDVIHESDKISERNPVHQDFTAALPQHNHH